jgi:hypothetical protein
VSTGFWQVASVSAFLIKLNLHAQYSYNLIFGIKPNPTPNAKSAVTPWHARDYCAFLNLNFILFLEIRLPWQASRALERPIMDLTHGAPAVAELQILYHHRSTIDPPSAGCNDIL